MPWTEMISCLMGQSPAAPKIAEQRSCPTRIGLDNVVLNPVLVSRRDARSGETARRLGLAVALFFRIALLFALSSLLRLSAIVLTLWDNQFSWHALILIFGGLFLIAKATHELHAQIESQLEGANRAGGSASALPARDSMALVISQIVLIDVIFSIDSIVTAIGMAQDIRIMIAAVLIAVAVMYAASGPVAGFIAAHPTTKTLALAFLLLAGVAL